MAANAGFTGVLGASLLLAATAGLRADDNSGGLRKAMIDGEGPGWRALTLDDFVNVNCAADTWSTHDG